MSKVISLVSGGLDSLLATDVLLSEGNEVLMMFGALNQSPEAQEREAAKHFYNFFESEYRGRVHFHEITVDLHGTKKVESAWGRTMLLLGLALTYNYSQLDNYYDALAIGSHKGDVGPDCNPDKLTAFTQSVWMSTKGSVKLLLPIAALDQDQIGKEFRRRALPLSKTFSCYWSIPCGYRSIHDTYLCPGCRRKVVAMKAAGYTESDVPNSPTRTFQSNLAEPLTY